MHNYTWKKRLFFSLMIIAISILSIFIIIEVCYRMYMIISPPLRVYDPDGAKFNPNGVGKYKGSSVILDKHGFRNGIDTGAWEKKRKIMLIGDSVCFGLGVDNEYTISHILNQEFSSASFGFLNLGHPGWDTPALVDLLYKQTSKLAQWDMIIWLYCINDAKTSSNYNSPLLDDKSADRRMEINFSGKLQWLIHRFFKWPFILKPKIKALFLKIGLQERDQRKSSWESYYKWCMSSYDLESENRKNEERYIHDIVIWSQRNKSALLFVLCPAELQFVDGNTRPQNFIKELGKRYNFPVIDLMHDLATANKRGRIFLPNDRCHLNPRGNRIIADIIKEWLVSNGYTGSEK